MSKEPIEIKSVSEWNTILRAAKAAGQTVIVDFHAVWCGPCKQIAPIYTSLASQYPFTHFLRVDVDGPGTKAIAAKYQITAMPTFLAIKPNDSSSSNDPQASKTGQVVETLRGADPQGLHRMVAAHASHAYTPNSTLGSTEAEEGKKKGNEAFAQGRFKDAVEEYTKAIKLAPQSGVLYANRALAYIRMIQSKDKDGSGDTSAEERKVARVKAIEDAQRATNLEERWGKAWVRMAEAMLLSTDEEAMEDVEASKRAAGRKMSLLGVEEALENAVGLSDGKVKAEAEKMLGNVRKELNTA
ncbi:thioredoxin-like protein, partial [Dendrothele bispora CBS 962.96]